MTELLTIKSTEASPISTPLLELRQFGCERDERQLFSQLNLCGYAGDVIQIIGPNGSGKTTLLRALSGISQDFTGQMFWRGQPFADAAWEYARDLLYLGHLPGIKKALSPAENLSWYVAIAGGFSRNDIADALERVGLYGYEDTPCYQLSAGQLRRVALARLYLNRACLWILDEPFTAIDKKGASELEQVFASHAAAGGLIILTSHQDLALSTLKQVNLLDYQPSVSEADYV